MSHGRYTRKGMIAELEEELQSIESRLRSLAESVGDRLLALSSHLDTDGEDALNLMKQYHDLQQEGRNKRKRIQELRNE